MARTLFLATTDYCAGDLTNRPIRPVRSGVKIFSTSSGAVDESPSNIARTSAPTLANRPTTRLATNMIQSVFVVVWPGFPTTPKACSTTFGGCPPVAVSTVCTAAARSAAFSPITTSPRKESPPQSPQLPDRRGRAMLSPQHSSDESESSTQHIPRCEESHALEQEAV